ncbi:thioesterase II family protein [Glaciimonas immobilis]|uniref:Medium-chain acyl-[acyl-carrier-protein] hydrolase n=1 Tax=Glaciimonas immobilis TaxID=728004 RepID=A0A840RWM5_9BURK|nr:alpha/beta fold hydrolase [Glaciimonas immobilis]KAF3996557.1 thioesterase [Glaciimonas immobilis]MBB5201074.1 medium-chain acyl-[acyl-carrier-protein] hydrolase [Glaciimonas immobilis]
MSSTAGCWFTHLSNHAQANGRLFTFPFAGGGPSVYRHWPELLPSLEIFAACLPGRESRINEPHVTSMDALMAQLLPAIVPLLDRDFFFYGHSMGALVAFELAHALKQQGLRQPKCLLIGACQSPNITPNSHRLNTLPDAQFFRALSTYGGLPEGLANSAELQQLILPTLRADLSIPASYRFSANPPLTCPIIAFCGESDMMVTKQNMSGWRDMTSASYFLHEMPGDHFFLHPQRIHLLEMIKTGINIW